jgi:hypothetical protein
MLKKRRSIIYLLMVVFFISFPVTMIKAHNPESMSLVYSLNTHRLEVIITHPTGGAPNHFIISVEIKINGSTERLEYYSSQPADNFIYRYDNVTANIRTTIRVIATCSVAGSITESLIGEASTNGTPAISGYLGLSIVMGIMIITCITIIYKKIKLM